MNPILVTGATGLVGGALIRRLSSRGLAVRALARNPDKPAARALGDLPGVVVVRADLGDANSLAPALDGIERAMLISTSDESMQTVQCSFVDAAERAQLGQVVKLSGIMQDVSSPFRFARMHGEIERHLANSGVPFVNLRAGEFMHSYFRQLPSLAKGALALPLGDARIASIDIDDVAAAAAICLSSPIEKYARQSFALTGPEALSMNEVAERLSRVAGRAIRYVDVSPEEARRARLANGMPAYRADALDELFAERRRGLEAHVSPELQSAFGVKATSFLEFAERHAKIFRGEEPPPAMT
jgi:uncharacterized protein YbjT (DUF2867 family)